MLRSHFLFLSDFMQLCNVKENATLPHVFNPPLHNFLFQRGIHLRTRDITNIYKFYSKRNMYLFSSNVLFLTTEKSSKTLNFVNEAFSVVFI